MNWVIWWWGFPANSLDMVGNGYSTNPLNLNYVELIIRFSSKLFLEKEKEKQPAQNYWHMLLPRFLRRLVTKPNEKTSKHWFSRRRRYRKTYSRSRKILLRNDSVEKTSFLSDGNHSNILYGICQKSAVCNSAGLEAKVSPRNSYSTR